MWSSPAAGSLTSRKKEGGDLSMASYGAVETGLQAAAPRTRSRHVLAASLATAGALALVAVAIVTHYGTESSDTSLLSAIWIPLRAVEVEEPISMLHYRGPMNFAPIERDALMLYDAALDPLYKDDADPIAPYVWVGLHKDEYDPVAQNAFADLPMKRADIVDPDSEFEADKDMTKSCDKTGSCKDEENVWKDLPAEEDKTLAKRNKNPPADEAWDAWSKIPLDY